MSTFASIVLACGMSLRTEDGSPFGRRLGLGEGVFEVRARLGVLHSGASSSCGAAVPASASPSTVGGAVFRRCRRRKKGV